MKISNLVLGANIKIPECREDGTYELADYTLGCYNNFGINTVGLVRKYIHSLCRFGDNVEYAGSDLDKRMTEIFDSYPDELQNMIVDVKIPLYCVGANPIEITRSVFAPTYTMVGYGDNHGVNEGFTWPIFTGQNSRKKTFNGSATSWWLPSQYSSDFARHVDSVGSAYILDPLFANGVVPMFVLPQSVQIDYLTDNDGSYFIIFP